jgi:hypothetical protein
VTELYRDFTATPTRSRRSSVTDVRQEAEIVSVDLNDLRSDSEIECQVSGLDIEFRC